jgi:hypothetical protein
VACLQDFAVYDPPRMKKGDITAITLALRAAFIGMAASLLVACFGGGGSNQSGGPPPVSTPPPSSGNRAPIISVAAAAEVLVGRTLTIRPTATDPDGDALTYQVSNLPAWMSFSSQTGVLTGTPTAGDVGVFNSVITVSDGKSQASGQARITVSQSVSGRATLSWQAPTDNVDGSPLTDLAGFRVYYGNSANDLRYFMQVADPGARSRIVEDLTVGTWYFAATAYDQSGGESARSNVTAKTIA